MLFNLDRVVCCFISFPAAESLKQKRAGNFRERQSAERQCLKIKSHELINPTRKTGKRTDDKKSFELRGNQILTQLQVCVVCVGVDGSERVVFV